MENYSTHSIYCIHLVLKQKATPTVLCHCELSGHTYTHSPYCASKSLSIFDKSNRKSVHKVEQSKYLDYFSQSSAVTELT